MTKQSTLKEIGILYSAWHLKATYKKVWRPNLGQKFQHKFEEFFEFGLGDVGLGLWSGMASTPFGGPVHRHAQAHTTSSSPTSNSQTIVATMGRFNKWKQQLKRLTEARQARRDKDESGCEEEEEVTVFDGETTVDVDVDVLSEDAVW